MGVTGGAELRDFLDAPDLEALRAAREALEGLDEDDDAHISAVVEDWAPPQALANVLMYPEVLPDDRRQDVLLRALGRPVTDYAVLAAAVGLQHLADLDPPSGGQRAALLAALVAVVARADGVVRSRALVALTALAPHPAEDVAALADAGRVTAADAETVRRLLDELGGRLPPLAYIPNYNDWDTA